jgi:hypothetical protein
MKITLDQTYEATLANFGLDYAPAFSRTPAYAIASDIDSCLASEGRLAVINLAREARIFVKYFKQPNSSNLFGLVECFLPLDQDSGELLAELLVTTKESQFYVGLESVSYAA